MTSTDVAVVGAYGVVGRRVCEALGGLSVVRLGRGEPMVDAKVVVNAAAPLRDSALPVLDAAIARGAHYIDVGGEQAVMRAIYEQRESSARKAGIVALPGCGLDGAIGDLAAAWAAGAEDGELVRDRAPDRITADEVAVIHLYDRFALSAGAQAALFASVGEPVLAWVRDRWEKYRGMRTVNDGELREAIANPGGAALSVPRHIDAPLIASYASTTKNAIATRALGLLARAMPRIPRAVGGVLAPYAVGEDELAQTTFRVIAQVRRDFTDHTVTVRGADPSRTTGRIAAWFARLLVERTSGPLGVRAPAELVRAPAALRALADAAQLSIDVVP